MRCPPIPIIGATLSFPRVPAKVPSPSDLPTFAIVRVNRWFAEFTTSTHKRLEGEPDGGEGNEGAQSFGKVLQILGKTPVAAKPGESALDHPAVARRERRSEMTTFRPAAM